MLVRPFLSIFCGIPLELADDRTIREEHTRKADAHDGHPDCIAIAHLFQSSYCVLALLLHHLARFLYLMPAYLCVAVGFLNDATVYQDEHHKLAEIGKQCCAGYNQCPEC